MLNELKHFATSLLGRLAVAREEGQALVEFALVLPFLMLGLFGLAQGGLAFNSGIDQTHIANEIARYAVVNENPGGAESLQKWAKIQADQSALKTGKVCITFPNGTAKV